MTRGIIALLLTLPVLTGCAAAMDTQVTDDPLAHLRKDHPRLLFTDEDLARAQVAAASDPLRAELAAHIVATAEYILHAPPIRQPDNAGSHEQDRYAVYDIVTCAMAYRLTGDERFFERAKNDSLTCAQFSDWDPKHFLSVGEMSFAVAIGYDWLYPKLTPGERAILKKGLMDNGLVFTDEVYGNPTTRKADWNGERGGNWNQVCNTGLLSAALAIADEEPDLARKVIAGVRQSYPVGMNAYSPDGSYPEGPGYWTYGTTYAAIGITELETSLGTDLGIQSSPGFDRTINYYEAEQGAFGPVFNYADATDDLQNSPARAFLAKRFNSPFAMADTRRLLIELMEHSPGVKFDRGIQGSVINRFFALHEVWFPEKPEGTVVDLPLDSHFRGPADIATFRTAWNDRDAIYVGFKAGDTEMHHTQLDLGSFVLDANGRRWAMDLGPDNTRGNYAPGWGDVKTGKRWTFFRANNHGHNTVTPGDALQKTNIVAPIIKFQSTPGRAFAVADLTPAYPDEAVSLQRGIALLDRARVLVQDEYQPAASKLPLHWVMITPAKIEISDDGRSAELTSDGERLRADLLGPTPARFHIGSTRPPTAAEIQNDGTAMLAIDVVPNADGSTTRVDVLLTPEGGKWPVLGPPVIRPLAQW
jgi:heparinase II/III-like protein